VSSDASLLGLIRDTPWIAELLREFDFDLERPLGPVEEVHLEGGEPLEVFAGDASGGAFMLVGSDDPHPVVYLDSEGSGGLIATGLRDALALVVGLSSIHDATARPVGDELRRWLAKADDEIREDWPDLDADRQRLREALDLPAADDRLLESFHRAAADERFRPINAEGDRFDSMVS
jgi:hypothetical protein